MLCLKMSAWILVEFDATLQAHASQDTLKPCLVQVHGLCFYEVFAVMEARSGGCL